MSHRGQDETSRRAGIKKGSPGAGSGPPRFWGAGLNQLVSAPLLVELWSLGGWGGVLLRAVWPFGERGWGGVVLCAGDERGTLLRRSSLMRSARFTERTYAHRAARLAVLIRRAALQSTRIVHHRLG